MGKRRTSGVRRSLFQGSGSPVGRGRQLRAACQAGGAQPGDFPGAATVAGPAAGVAPREGCGPGVNRAVGIHCSGQIPLSLMHFQSGGDRKDVAVVCSLLGLKR